MARALVAVALMATLCVGALAQSPARMQCKSIFVALPRAQYDKNVYLIDGLRPSSMKLYCQNFPGAVGVGSFRTRTLRQLGRLDMMTIDPETGAICQSPDCIALVGVECIPAGQRPCPADDWGNIGNDNEGTMNFGNHNIGNNNIGNQNIPPGRQTELNLASNDNIGDGNSGNNNIGCNNEGDGNIGSNFITDSNKVKGQKALAACPVKPIQVPFPFPNPKPNPRPDRLYTIRVDSYTGYAYVGGSVGGCNKWQSREPANGAGYAPGNVQYPYIQASKYAYEQSIATVAGPAVSLHQVNCQCLKVSTKGTTPPLRIRCEIVNVKPSQNPRKIAFRLNSWVTSDKLQTYLKDRWGQIRYLPWQPPYAAQPGGNGACVLGLTACPKPPPVAPPLLPSPAPPSPPINSIVADNTRGAVPVFWKGLDFGYIGGAANVAYGLAFEAPAAHGFMTQVLIGLSQNGAAPEQKFKVTVALFKGSNTAPFGPVGSPLASQTWDLAIIKGTPGDHSPTTIPPELPVARWQYLNLDKQAGWKVVENTPYVLVVSVDNKAGDPTVWLMSGQPNNVPAGRVGFNVKGALKYSGTWAATDGFLMQVMSRTPYYD